MTTNKTTALIEAARRQGFENRFRGTMLDLTRDIFPRDYFYKSADTNAAWEGYQSAWEEALAAFDKPQPDATALIEAAREVIRCASMARRYELGVGGQTMQACAERTVLYRMPLTPIQALEEAIAAFEQPAVSEMTANEIEKLITQRCHEITMLTAKLGTIKVVEKDNG